MAATRDWVAWHEPYADRRSPLSRRLQIVQFEISAWLDANPDRPVRVLSVCAGDGRDLLGVLPGRKDARRVAATMLESDARLVQSGEVAAARASLAGVSFRRADAGSSDAYTGAVPADLLLICGVFGNISAADVCRTIGALPQVCAPRATVIWTRSRRAPDLTLTIRNWFGESGFVEASFHAPNGELFTVGVHRLVAESEPLAPHRRLFDFSD